MSHINNRKRKELHRAIGLLNQGKFIVRNVLDNEQDCLDNLPENLQDSERAIKFEDAVDALESAEEDIDSAIDYVKGVI